MNHSTYSLDCSRQLQSFFPCLSFAASMRDDKVVAFQKVSLLPSIELHVSVNRLADDTHFVHENGFSVSKGNRLSHFLAKNYVDHERRHDPRLGGLKQHPNISNTFERVPKLGGILCAKND